MVSSSFLTGYVITKTGQNTCEPFVSLNSQNREDQPTIGFDKPIRHKSLVRNNLRIFSQKREGKPNATF